MRHQDQNFTVWFLIWTTGVYAERENGNIELENKKLEKESKNEQEKEKKENMTKENQPMNSTSQITVKGLSNLGNTCFFNAVMQNLSQTPVLRELLKEVKMSGTIVKIEPPDLALTEPLEINLEPPGPLTLAMSQFLNEMQETKKGVVTPKELFAQVCKKAVRFKGYQQQDSQELLRYLLDGMRAEEHQRVSKGILKAFGNSTEKLDEELKNKVKDYEKKKSIPSFVDRIFGGELTSTIMCDECRTVSLVHESFLDLSLPVLDDQSGKKSINDKNLKKTMEDENKDSEEEKDNDSYIKERNDIPSGPSKHLQKKAKKQAKKQAKGEVDIKSDHISKEEVIHEEYCVSQKDLDGQEKVIEIVTDNQKSTEEVDIRNMNMDNDLEALASSPIECTRNLNGAYLNEGSSGEVDITSGFKNLSLNATLQPEEINIEILSDSHSPGTTVYEVVNEDPETAFCTLANREAFSTDECSIQHCLYQFTRNEKLRDANKLLCEVCTRRQYNGSKTNIKDDTPPEESIPLAFPELDQQLQPLPPCHDSMESMQVFKQHCQIAEEYHEVKKEIALLEERKKELIAKLDQAEKEKVDAAQLVQEFEALTEENRTLKLAQSQCVEQLEKLRIQYQKRQGSS
ncbi:Ubiquitin carboxyl-terminal hydrolase 16 [Tupaia chinensis]|uniref:Ubiquitin carboxyl-terminal hydrolase 16 n=1 Tax=Tupaia chinensis TaxID=246437 RepID=L8YFJ7_TUPCH|nr:Ubiquitin carboxyl-terminal hydrolase 16 [Tupaia chinensis]